jgi:PST family polysaccharide transporter
VNTKHDKLLSDSAMMVAASGLSAVFAMLYSSTCARLLSPVGFGEVAAALSISYFLSLAVGPLEAGVTKLAAAAHGVGNRPALRALYSRALRRTLQLTLMGSALWLLAAWLLKWWLHVEGATLWALTAYILLLFVASVPRAIMQGDHRFGAYGRVQVADALARLMGGAFFVVNGLGPAGAIAGYGVGTLAAFVYARWQLRDLFRGSAESAAVGEPAKAQGVPLAIAYFYFLFCLNADVLTAKHFLPPAEAGLYGAVNTLSRMLYLVAIPIYQVLFSRVSALASANQPTGPLVRRGLLLLSTLLLSSCVVPFFLGDLLIKLVFGDRFAGAAAPLQILWMTTVVLTLQSAITFVLIGTNRTRGLVVLLAPCGLMFGLLLRNHASATQVAQAGLAAAVLGLALIVGLSAFSLKRTA